MLEKIVRPFQTPDVFKIGRIISNSTKIPTEAALISWGVSGDMPTAEEIIPLSDPAEPGGSFKVIECKDKNAEVKRTSTPVLVENPDDQDQYLVYDRLDKVEFNKKEKPKNPARTSEARPAPAPGPFGYSSPLGFLGNGAAPISIAVDESKLCKVEYLFNNQDRKGFVVAEPTVTEDENPIGHVRFIPAPLSETWEENKHPPPQYVRIGTGSEEEKRTKGPPPP